MLNGISQSKLTLIPTQSIGTSVKTQIPTLEGMTVPPRHVALLRNAYRKLNVHTQYLNHGFGGFQDEHGVAFSS